MNTNLMQSYSHKAKPANWTGKPKSFLATLAKPEHKYSVDEEYKRMMTAYDNLLKYAVLDIASTTGDHAWLSRTESYDRDLNERAFQLHARHYVQLVKHGRFYEINEDDSKLSAHHDKLQSALDKAGFTHAVRMAGIYKASYLAGYKSLKSDAKLVAHTSDDIDGFIDAIRTAGKALCAKPSKPSVKVAKPVVQAPVCQPVAIAALEAPAVEHVIPLVDPVPTVQARAELNRVNLWLFFDGRPSDTVLSQLKECGFKWGHKRIGWWCPVDTTPPTPQDSKPAPTTTARGIPVWQTDASTYQYHAGVKQPHIMELGPDQYRRFSKRGLKRYEDQRSKEWQASADCKTEWRDKVIEAYERGEFTEDSDGVTEQVKSVLFRYEQDQLKLKFDAIYAQHYRKLAAEDLQVGARVWSIMCRKYGIVKTVSKKSARIEYDNGTFKEMIGALYSMSYGDAETAALTDMNMRVEKTNHGTGTNYLFLPVPGTRLPTGLQPA